MRIRGPRQKDVKEGGVKGKAKTRTVAGRLTSRQPRSPAAVPCGPSLAPAAFAISVHDLDALPPPPAPSRLRRTLERRQVERDQRARRAQAPRLHEQDARAARRHINFFALRRKRRAWSTCPGYGYAAVPHAVRAPLAGARRRLSADRARRCAAWCVIMDARHPLTPLDQQLLELARARCAAARAALEGGQALARRAGADLAAGERRRSRSRRRPCSFFRAYATGRRRGRDLLERWLEQAG